MTTLVLFLALTLLFGAGFYLNAAVMIYRGAVKDQDRVYSKLLAVNDKVHEEQCSLCEVRTEEKR